MLPCRSSAVVTVVAAGLEIGPDNVQRVGVIIDDQNWSDSFICSLTVAAGRLGRQYTRRQSRQRCAITASVQPSFERVRRSAFQNAPTIAPDVPAEHDQVSEAALRGWSGGQCASPGKSGAKGEPHEPAYAPAAALSVVVTRELELVEPGVEPPAREQLGVCALLAQLAMVQHEDAVGVLYGRQAVRDDESMCGLP